MSRKLLKAYSAKEISQIINGEIIGDESFKVDQVNGIKTACASSLSFCSKDRQSLLKQSNVGIAIVDAGLDCPNVAIVVDNPRLQFAKFLAYAFAKEKIDPGIHKTAQIGKGCEIADDALISANCVIGNNCKIGAGVVLQEACIIEDNVVIGDNSLIGYTAIIYENVCIGKRCIISAGALIGKSGFGFVKDSNGFWVKVPQIGSVIIEDDVEIGVNSSIDRGAIDDTIIKRGVKCDNLVQIGHNCIIGENTLICGCVGISGSVIIGANCILAGGAMVGDNISIASNVMVAGAGAVRQNIEKAGRYAGDPARPVNSWLKDSVNIANLSKMKSKIRALEKVNDGKN